MTDWWLPITTLTLPHSISSITAPVQTEFYYKGYKFTCAVVQLGQGRALTIHDDRGQVLALQPEQRRGLVRWQRPTGAEVRLVDLRSPGFSELIHAAMAAIATEMLPVQVESIANLEMPLASEIALPQSSFWEPENAPEGQPHDQSTAGRATAGPLTKKPNESQEELPTSSEPNGKPPAQSLPASSVELNLETCRSQTWATDPEPVAELAAKPTPKEDPEAISDRLMPVLARLEQLSQQFQDFSIHQEQRFHRLETELSQRESALQTQEAYLRQIQLHLGQQTTQLDLSDLKQQLVDHLGKSVWRSLRPRTRQDLYAAYRQGETLKRDRTATQPDYSEAGLRLGFVVEREVIQPFFQALYDYSRNTGFQEIGGLSLGQQRRYTLGMLPPLLAEQWYSLRDRPLRQPQRADEDDLYGLVSFNRTVSQGDRDRIQAFLKTWSHPLAQWLQRQSTAAASTIDQVNKLRNIAAHAESILHFWQYELMQSLVLGTRSTPGLFSQIFTQSEPLTLDKDQ